MTFEIKGLKSKRDSVYKTPAQKAYAMPPPGNTIFVGMTGSGKTNCAASLLKEPEMLKDYFDKIHVICMSPCTTLSDHVDEIEEEDFLTEDDPEDLVEIYNTQKAAIKKLGFKRAPHILIVLDDIVQSKNYMNSKVLKEIFFGGTHNKVSTWLLSQNYVSVPRRLRVNCHALLLFHGSNATELDRFQEEFQTQHMDKKAFRAKVEHTISEPYSFIFCNRTNPNKKKMFLRNFTYQINLGEGPETPEKTEEKEGAS
tara:strand:+ start:2676 stop:3440 length:765 start_codon:yes stop_codon:yes gene_type:complete